ncbi:hypothetical protein P7C70_g6094, partial [Phenoliferia sp. Uapishka_3]
KESCGRGGYAKLATVQEISDGVVEILEDDEIYKRSKSSSGTSRFSSSDESKEPSSSSESVSSDEEREEQKRKALKKDKKEHKKKSALKPPKEEMTPPKPASEASTMTQLMREFSDLKIHMGQLLSAPQAPQLSVGMGGGYASPQNPLRPQYNGFSASATSAQPNRPIQQNLPLRPPTFMPNSLPLGVPGAMSGGSRITCFTCGENTHGFKDLDKCATTQDLLAKGLLTLGFNGGLLYRGTRLPLRDNLPPGITTFAQWVESEEKRLGNGNGADKVTLTTLRFANALIGAYYGTDCGDYHYRPAAQEDQVSEEKFSGAFAGDYWGAPDKELMGFYDVDAGKRGRAAESSTLAQPQPKRQDVKAGKAPEARTPPKIEEVKEDEEMTEELRKKVARWIKGVEYLSMESGETLETEGITTVGKEDLITSGWVRVTLDLGQGGRQELHVERGLLEQCVEKVAIQCARAAQGKSKGGICGEVYEVDAGVLVEREKVHWERDTVGREGKDNFSGESAPAETGGDNGFLDFNGEREADTAIKEPKLKFKHFAEAKAAILKGLKESRALSERLAAVGGENGRSESSGSKPIVHESFTAYKKVGKKVVPVLAGLSGDNVNPLFRPPMSRDPYLPPNPPEFEYGGRLTDEALALVKLGGEEALWPEEKKLFLHVLRLREKVVAKDVKELWNFEVDSHQSVESGYNTTQTLETKAYPPTLGFMGRHCETFGGAIGQDFTSHRLRRIQGGGSW